MADLRIHPSRLKGEIVIPSSKSHTLRAIVFAFLAKGVSVIEKILPSPDTEAMIRAVTLLGAEVTRDGQTLKVKGVAGQPKVADDVIQCGNSGQVLRFIGAISALNPAYTILTGDASIRHSRQVAPLLTGLSELGAIALSSRGDGYAPILIKGPLTRNMATIEGQDSQPVSGLLMAAAFAPHPIDLHVVNPGEKPWVSLTLDWFSRLGIPFTASDFTHYRMQGSAKIDAFHYIVPGDFSSLAFPIAAALITDSELVIRNVDMSDIQGDKIVISHLRQMGAKIDLILEEKTLIVRRGSLLKGMRIDINDCIDALPILAVVGCFAEGKTEIFNGSIARKKESDRIALMASELKKMGGKIEEREDGLVIESCPLQGAYLETHNDHRLALSLSVAAFGAFGESVIANVECVDKTYPSFYSDFIGLGAKIK